MRTEVSRYQLEPGDIERSGVMIPILVRESTGVAMVDTGARITVIDIEYTRELGLEEDGTHRITGDNRRGGVPQVQDRHPGPLAQCHRALTSGRSPLRTNNIPWNALIGRDVILPVRAARRMERRE